MYRTIVTVEVLSEDEILGYGLGDIAHQIDRGDWSGKTTVGDSQKLTKQQMAQALRAQGSDPTFLLDVSGWIYELHEGDEVTVDAEASPDAPGRVVVIQSISFRSREGSTDEEVAVIDTKAGEHLELHISRLS